MSFLSNPVLYYSNQNEVKIMIYELLLLCLYGNKVSVYLKGCLHVRFCALGLTSWSMCLTDDSVEDKLQQFVSGYLAA